MQFVFLFLHLQQPRSIIIGYIKISTSKELHNQQNKYKAGDTVTFLILCENEKMTVEITLQESVPEKIE